MLQELLRQQLKTWARADNVWEAQPRTQKLTTFDRKGKASCVNPSEALYMSPLAPLAAWPGRASLESLVRASGRLAPTPDDTHTHRKHTSSHRILCMCILKDAASVKAKITGSGGIRRRRIVRSLGNAAARLAGCRGALDKSARMDDPDTTRVRECYWDGHSPS